MLGDSSCEAASIWRIGSGQCRSFFFFYILTDFCYGYETFLHENKQVVSEVLTLTCLRAFRVLFLALYGSLECLIVQLLSMTIR